MMVREGVVGAAGAGGRLPRSVLEGDGAPDAPGDAQTESSQASNGTSPSPKTRVLP
jgi:hypothetical protein